MSISTDYWHDNGNGTAWIVCPNEIEHDSDPDWLRLAFWHGSDRPCDTCGGTGTHHALFADVPGRCPDCINGRHTFEIEVAWRDGVDSYESESHRVSIEPGMVLPIVENDSDTRRPVISLQYGHPYLLDEKLITRVGDGFPPSAAPGMYAVLVNLAPEGTTP